MMRNFRLNVISACGLKSRDFRVELGDETVLVGENGRSKSAVIDAIFLLALGGAPNADRTGDGILTLARGNELEVEGWGVDSQGETWTLLRCWKRDRDGRVSETITGTLAPGEMKTKQKSGHIAGILGAFAEAWAPAEILDLSAAKLRSRLLSRVPQRELSAGSVVPSDCPEWALPRHAGKVSAVEWAQWAVKRAQAEVDQFQKSIREMKRKVDEDLGDAWTKEEPVEPLHDELRALRQDLLAIQAAVGDADRCKKAEEKFYLANARRSKIDAPPIENARFIAAVLEVAAGESRALRKAGAGEIASAQRERDMALAEVRPIAHSPSIIPLLIFVSEEDLVGCEREFAEVEADRRILDGRLGAARAELAEVTDPAIPVCPHCGVDLLEDYARLRVERTERVRFLEADATVLDLVLEETRTKATALRRGISLAGIVARHEASEAKLLEVKARVEVEALDLLSLEEAAMADKEAFRILNAAQERFRAEREVEAAFQELTVARAALRPSAGATDNSAAVEIRIRDLEKELARIAVTNARRKELEAEEKGIEEFKSQEELRKLWLLRFTEIQTDLLDRARGWLEKRLSDGLGGARIEVALIDARGNDDCRFIAGGVDAATLSGGEEATFLASLVIALAEASDAAWKPLILDGFERVSKKFREPFMHAVLDAVRSGRISQAIIAGCQDSTPAVEGVDVVDMDAPEIAQKRKLAVV